jgi:hypothetical protein
MDRLSELKRGVQLESVEIEIKETDKGKLLFVTSISLSMCIMERFMPSSFGKK